LNPPLSPHPSFLELDRLALGVGLASSVEHAAGCSTCSAYVSRRKQPSAVPAWVEHVRPGRARWAWRGGVTALAAAAALIAVVTTSQLRQPDTIAVKGTPSVALHVKRGERTSRWDGASPFQPGDALRAEVAPAGFTQVALVSRSGDTYAVLYSGPVEPEGVTLLPGGWRLDAAPGPETLLVVFSRSPMTPEQVGQLESGDERSAGVWSERIVLPKVPVER
jgi:hypothetical protein